MNLSLIVNIVISVFSGILSAGLLYLIAQYFNKIFIPWYRGMRYKGIDISGRWFEIHNYEGLLIQESTVTIKQSAEQINGEIILAKKHTKTDKIIELKSFKLKGNFQNNFLNITCWNSDKKQIGIHNYLLTVKLDGREMKGIKTYYDTGFEKIRTADISWSRKEHTK